MSVDANLVPALVAVELQDSQIQAPESRRDIIQTSLAGLAVVETESRQVVVTERPSLIVHQENRFELIAAANQGPPGPPGLPGSGGTAGHFPFYTADGTSDPINLTADTELPFFAADGTAANIAMTV